MGKAIGVFDSGLGGLTVVKELNKILPEEDIIYFGDTARVPYGSRSRETLIGYMRDNVEFLMGHDAKIIISACGTTSSNALSVVSGEYDIPMVGVIDGSAEAAANVSVTKKIAVLGTAATIKNGAFERALVGIDKEIEVFGVPCPMFVPLVENGFMQHDATRLIAREYLESLKNREIDTIILGCTHFSLLRGIISDIMGDKVTLVDTGKTTAMETLTLLKKNDLLGGGSGKRDYYVSELTDNFEKIGSMFLGEKIGNVQLGT